MEWSSALPVATAEEQAVSLRVEAIADAGASAIAANRRAVERAETPCGELIRASSDDELRSLALWAQRELTALHPGRDVLDKLVAPLARRSLGWTAPEVIWMLRHTPIDYNSRYLSWRLRLPMSALKRLDATELIRLTPALALLHRELFRGDWRETRQLAQRVAVLIARATPAGTMLR